MWAVGGVTGGASCDNSRETLCLRMERIGFGMGGMGG